MEDLDSVEEEESGEDLDGGGGEHKERVSVQCELDSGQGVSQRGAGLDPTAVEATWH
jgi:hypothetical protein